MSTRSTIGIRNSDKTISSVYCHSDGYLQGVGLTLVNHYNTKEKAEELISHGGISNLGPIIGEKHDFSNHDSDACTFYHRDRGEQLEIAKSYGINTRFIAYLFVDDHWTMLHGKEWVKLEDLLEEWKFPTKTIKG